VQRDLAQVVTAAERATRLTHQLLAFARREVVQPAVIDLNDVVTGLDELLHRTLGEHVTLHTHLGERLWPVLADPGQLEQVLVNLAVNARDALAAGGSLSIDTDNVEVDEFYAVARPELTPGRYVSLKVSDTGTGMPREVIERAFEPFFTTKGPGDGTGLGLATVYGIVSQAGGRVEIYSETGLGTTVAVLLPATEQPAVAAQPVRAELPIGAQLTVLVVEDEPALREVARRILTRAGHRVLVAEDGPRAIELARHHESAIDLLLTDVVMPRMLGNEVAEHVQELHPEIHVLFMSGYAQPALGPELRIDPQAALIDKPFSAATLLAAISGVFEARARLPHGSA
jgi:two-component system, cell cycle sensor histidine kinase and response regulator CckA